MQLGSGLAINGIPGAGRYGFWGDKRPGQQFVDHVLETNPSLSAGADIEIWKNSSTSWKTSFDGYPGLSTGNTWQAIDHAGRRWVVVGSIGLVAAGLAVGLSAQAGSAASAAPATFLPSAAQAGKAIVVAHLEAATTVPGPKGSPVASSTAGVPTDTAPLLAAAARASSWPADVTRVKYIGTYRRTAEQFLDGTTIADNRAVVVMRMTGHFSVLISAPKGTRPYATGTVLTAVLDAATGQVLDFGLGNSARALPKPLVVFRR